jgi:hypothetical protein
MRDSSSVAQLLLSKLGSITLIYKKTSTLIKKKKPSMKRYSKSIMATFAAGFLSCGLLSQDATATLITGSISFTGQVLYDTGDLSTADAITSWNNARTQGTSSGSFSGIAQNTAANSNVPWNFDPSTPMPALLSVGGFTFDLLTSTIVNQGGGFLTIQGTGIISSTNEAFESTVGNWVFTSQDTSNNSKFKFMSGNAPVPDGGSALALLGIGLVTIEALRRRFGAA